MKFPNLPLSFLVASGLTACVGGNVPDITPLPNQPGVPPTANVPLQPGSSKFSCQNGLTVNIRRLGNDQIELRLDNKTSILDAAVSGSGERYASNSGLFGTGAEWHQKGDEAIFTFTDPYGNPVQSICNKSDIHH